MSTQPAEIQHPYTVLARRFRPQSFDEVVGQQQIGQALRNAINSGRVAHAYLFTGARGVGKTSTARIFAKALNCPNSQNATPCNDCEVCHAISAGSDVDVLEIDGASNRGIDDIRSLRSSVNVRSMRSPYKVYIIDEVHMLTKEAFNALLKTLEEPPPNVKFVFCTTEPNKVPETILSRCQRFDFGTIATDSIAERLTSIAESEGIRVEPDAIDLVARRAAGSMRDSQSLFDQLLAFGGDPITAIDVHRLLGTAPDERLFDLFDCVMAGDRLKLLESLEVSFQEGIQAGSLADQLLNFLRDLLVTATGAASVPLLSIADRLRPRLTSLAESWGLRSIAAAMQIVADCRSRMQKSTYGRPLVELALVRLTLLDELNAIADAIEGSAGAPTSAPRPSAPRPTPVSRPAVPAATTSVAEPSKKNAPVTATEEAATEAEDLSAQNPASETADPPKPLAFEPATIAEFWAQLLTAMPDAHRAHLANCSNYAISGPTALDVVFGASYFLSKSYCERAEAMSRLHAAASTIAGRPIQIRLKMDAAKSGDSTHSPKVTYDRKSTSLAQQDPFVQQAIGIFGGSVAELRGLHSGAAST
jgi:DNA polymerase-3 subunit gamma/tau